MGTDVQDAAEFYASARGGAARRLVRDRLHELWPRLDGMLVLGLGYAGPYLNAWSDHARCIAALPQPGGAAAELAAGLQMVVHDHALPLPGLSVDRVLMVHALESTEDARRLLREAWRVLKDDGRLLVVVPNRMGLWAHIESTPFGQGQPYSPGQLDRLLKASLFRVERRDRALYMPPVDRRAVLRSAYLLERAGRRMAPHLAGVAIHEAVKDLYAALPLGVPGRRKVVLTEAA